MASMALRLRIYLVTLLMGLLPVQGYAAALMFACPMKAAAAAEAPMPCHQTPAEKPSVPTPCDGCASCAASFTPAVPVFAVTLAKAPAPTSPIPFFGNAHGDHSPEALERPPRPHLV